MRPSAKVAQGFATNWFETTDNRKLEGFVIRESPTDVVMRDLGGVETTLRKAHHREPRRARRLDDAAGPGGRTDAERAGVAAGVSRDDEIDPQDQASNTGHTEEARRLTEYKRS